MLVNAHLVTMMVGLLKVGNRVKYVCVQVVQCPMTLCRIQNTCKFSVRFLVCACVCVLRVLLGKMQQWCEMCSGVICIGGANKVMQWTLDVSVSGMRLGRHDTYLKLPQVLCLNSREDAAQLPDNFLGSAAARFFLKHLHRKRVEGEKEIKSTKKWEREYLFWNATSCLVGWIQFT